MLFHSNLLFPEKDEESRESFEDITSNSLILITSKTRVISCKQEGKHCFYHFSTCEGVNDSCQGWLFVP
jgi:hypothetical protein